MSKSLANSSKLIENLPGKSHQLIKQRLSLAENWTTLGLSTDEISGVEKGDF
jgi:hypothetical protein